MTAYFRDAIGRLERHPRPGLIASFLEANVDGVGFSKDEMIANVIVTMVGGQETTTNLIANGVLTLLRNPGQHERLRNDSSLLPGAVEEMLRYEPPSQQTARLAPNDRRLGDRLIRAGQAVIAVMAAGNRDPERFPDPDTFDITRQDNRHLSFGWGPHFCFGAALARVEAHVVFEGLLRRFPNFRADFSTLEWRTNLGLRGLTSLPIAL
jgi:cytochrome P450